MSNISQKNVERRKELFTLILSRKTDKELAHLCRRSPGQCTVYAVCPDAKEGPCPFKAMCSDVDESHWSEVRAMVEKKEDNKMEIEAPFPLIDSSFFKEGIIDSYKDLLEENSVEYLAKQCNILGDYNTCPLANKDAACPFGSNKGCSEITADDWRKLELYVNSQISQDEKRTSGVNSKDGHKDTTLYSQESTVQEINTQETKESPVRCYYAYMVKEEKIVFYKGVFTRRKTVPVAFTSESQRDLFVRSTECSYAVSRRQLLHELADAYQDMSITELSRVISEIQRRAISATENSNGAITYSDYLYFDMAEIVFDI
jgi:hypothetical protein